jgi:hypothetical protein
MRLLNQEFNHKVTQSTTKEDEKLKNSDPFVRLRTFGSMELCGFLPQIEVTK